MGPLPNLHGFEPRSHGRGQRFERVLGIRGDRQTVADQQERAALLGSLEPRAPRHTAHGLGDDAQIH